MTTCLHNLLRRVEPIAANDSSKWACAECGNLFQIQPYTIGIEFGTRIPAIDRRTEEKKA